MTRKEQKVQSIQKEIDKLTKSLNRYKELLEKKIAKCEKLACNWNCEEFYKKRDSDELTQETFDAWFAKSIEEENVKDTERKLENAIARFEKANGEWEKELEQNEAEQEFINRSNAIEESIFENLKERKEKYEKWLKHFKAECLKDGVVIEEVSNNDINGKTKSGKSFVLYINNGFSKRSRYCYTLRIDGIVYFTSGTFRTCYKYLMIR